MTQLNTRTLLFLLLACCIFPSNRVYPAENERLSEVRLIQHSPDVSISDSFSLACNPVVINKLMAAPSLIAQLWQAYDFTPRYKIGINGETIHVDDPTGITGDLYLVEQTNDRRVYLGIGALNHALVPAFKGKMALVLTVSPNGSGSKARADVHIRTDSRVIGLLTRAFFPLVKARMVNRVTLNAQDLSRIVTDMSAAPAKTAALLKKDDAAALLSLISPQQPLTEAKKNPAHIERHK